MPFFDDPDDIMQRKRDADFARQAAAETERRTVAAQQREREGAVASASANLRSAAREFAAKAMQCGVSPGRYGVVPDVRNAAIGAEKYRLYVNGVSTHVFEGWWLSSQHPLVAVSKDGRLLGGSQQCTRVAMGLLSGEHLLYKLELSSADSVIFQWVGDPWSFELRAMDDLRDLLNNGASARPPLQWLVAR